MHDGLPRAQVQACNTNKANEMTLKKTSQPLMNRCQMCLSFIFSVQLLLFHYCLSTDYYGIGRERLQKILPTAAAGPPFFHPQTRQKRTCCDFALNRFPAEARIPLVITRSSPAKRDQSAPSSSGEISESQSRLIPHCGTATIIIPPEEVRDKFKRVKPLKDIPVTQRGWTLDVLNIVRRLVESRRRGDESGSAAGKEASLLTSAPTGEFTTADACIFERQLGQLHPDNRNVKAKIRQQLQELRDRNLLLHIDRNRWRLR